MKILKYSPNLVRDHYDVIIIGSGISGLCSSALLAIKGKKILLLEKHFKIGGYTHTFKRDKFEWDVGIHYVGGVHRKKSFTRKLFDKISNSNLKWNKMSDNYDRIIFPDKSYNFIAPEKSFIENIIAYFPDDESSIIAYVELVKKVNKTMFKYIGAKGLTGISEKLLFNYLSKGFLKYSDKTTYQALSEITSNQKLIGVLTGQWGDYGLPPKKSSFIMHCAIVGHYFDGGNYPIGGSAMIAESIVPQILDNDGHIFISTGVDKINIVKGKCKGVILENGDVINSNNVISSAGINNTITKFLREEKAFEEFNENIKKVEPSYGHACLYAGFNDTAKNLNISDTNLWVYPGYDHDLNTENYMSNEKNEFPLVYMSFASAKDPDWDKNHPGTATLEAIVPTSFDGFSKWSDKPWKNRGTQYEDFKESFSNRIIDTIYKHNPNLVGKISFSELSSPLSTRDMAHYQSGELYGINHTPDRFRQRWLKPKTPIKGFYMTGQDITTVGLPSALASGILTVSVLLKKNLFKEL